MPIPKNNERQEAVIEFVREYWAEWRFGPSYREIADGIGVASSSNATYWVRKLAREGLLAYAPGIARSVRVI